MPAESPEQVGVVKTYERPWRQHMGKQKEAPPSQPQRPPRAPDPEVQVRKVCTYSCCIQMLVNLPIV